MEYILITILIIIGILYNKRFSRSLRIFWLTVIWIAITLVLGLRYRVGVDTMNYMESFSHLPKLDNFKEDDFLYYRYEPLFLIINVICKTLFGGFWTVQIICCALTNGCIIIFLYRNCKNPFTALIIYGYISMLYFTTEIMRESVAIGISLLNFDKLKDKNLTRYYIFSIIALGFHYSAIVTWIFPFVKYLKFNLFFLMMSVGIIFITPLADALNGILELPANRAAIMNSYLEGNGLNLNYRFGILIQNLLPGVTACYLLSKRHMRIPFMHFFLLQVLFCFGTFAIPIIFQRFINYTQLFTIVILYSALWSRKITDLSKCFLVCLILVSQSQYYFESGSRWIPYVSIFSPRQIPERESIWLHQF